METQSSYRFGTGRRSPGAKQSLHYFDSERNDTQATARSDIEQAFAKTPHTNLLLPKMN